MGNARNCTKFYQSTGSTGKTGFYSNQFENYSSSLEWSLGDKVRSTPNAPTDILVNAGP